MARHDRFVLHGAAIVRDGRAFLLLGQSGAGKSTLAVAALEAGWQALADDVVILHASPDGFRIFGIHRTPAVPTEIGGPLAAAAPRLDDPRNRAELSRQLLTGGGHPLAGIVLITHADASAGSLREARGHQALPLLLQSFAGSIDPHLRTAFFAPGAAVSRLPVWELGHAADPAVRRERAAHHLDLCAAAL
jgi:ABC-type dipeptide/oligopeptide/nickel transport system ATPase component